MQYEGMIIPSDLAWAKQDSIAASKPVAQIAVQYTDGSSATLSLYPVPGGPDILDENGQPQEFDPDRFYGILSDGRFFHVSVAKFAGTYLAHRHVFVRF